MNEAGPDGRDVVDAEKRTGIGIPARRRMRRRRACTDRAAPRAYSTVNRGDAYDRAHPLSADGID
ncbi:hypothetical protein [Methylobacterium gossipiicola]|uniref:hypothetical protein n=1 Tax=Methylobacterium gossipiicola TaxID=582675 RepID=UPI001160DB6A|nr:hypothetical protein [Methylobacterium gossipiicola]